MRKLIVLLSLVLHVRTVKAQQPVHVPGSVLERYAGEWMYPAGNSVMLVVRGDTLFRELPGQRIPLVPISETGQMSRTDLRVTVRLKGDTLMRSMGGPEEPLIPITETRFRVGSTSLVTEFVIGETGDVTQVMGTGSRQMKARKPKS